jgi:hypothetical protein
VGAFTNIYEFFQSEDIAEHCRKIGHVFSPLDMAIIIDLSDQPMSKKHRAWQGIIDDYPDRPIHGSFNFEACDSLHTYLKELIVYEDLQVKNFMKKEDCVYQYEISANKKYGHRRSQAYSTFEKAVAALHEDWEREELDPGTRFYIIKVFIDKDISDQLCINYDGEIIHVDFSHTYNEESEQADLYKFDTLDMIFFDQPVPFVRGDLLLFDDYDGPKPGVLDWLPHWMSGKFTYQDYVAGKNSDGSDMIAYVYFINEDGHIIRDHVSTLHTLRYCSKDNLIGQDRFLEYLSRYIKSGDDKIDWLINVFEKFRVEAELEKQNSYFGGWYQELPT